MSTSDPDPARAPRAPQTPPTNPPATGRFTRGSGQPTEGSAAAPRIAAADAPPAAYPREGDAWSHEVGARRFEPSGPRGDFPVDATIYRPTDRKPEHNEPSIVTRAFEETVPPPSVLGSAEASPSPSAFVTDALGELTAEDQTRPVPPPRRIPGSPSTPPPGFGRS